MRLFIVFLELALYTRAKGRTLKSGLPGASPPRTTTPPSILSN